MKYLCILAGVLLGVTIMVKSATPIRYYTKSHNEGVSDRAKSIIKSIERGQWEDVRWLGYGADLKDGSYYIKIGWQEATIKYVNREIDYPTPSELHHINNAAKEYLVGIDQQREREDKRSYNRFR